MITLGELANSELDLMGAMTDDELLGALEAATQQERKTFIRRIKQPKPASGRSDSRSEFERRLHLLPKEIQQGLANKTLQAVDAAYYVTKSVSSNKIIKMLKDDDNKTVGISNISSAKLEKGNIMLLSGIVLLASVGIAKAEEGKYELLPKSSATENSSSKPMVLPLFPLLPTKCSTPRELLARKGCTNSITQRLSTTSRQWS